MDAFLREEQVVVSQPHSGLIQLYLADLHIGQCFTSGVHHMDAARIKSFAAEFDPQPFHLDEVAARSTIFKGLSASGWHTLAVSMRLLVIGGLPISNGLIGLSVELRWPKPTRPGDTLRVESESSRYGRRDPAPIRGVSKSEALH